MTANNAMEDHHHQCDNKKKKLMMEQGDLRMRTVDCLRGRLLAEREASKLAHQQAQFMSDKLVELEDKLIKKLQSLQISPTFPALDLHSSSDNSSEISEFSSSKSQNSIQDSSCSTPNIQHSNADSQSSSSISSEESTLENNNNNNNYVDNSLALVPVNSDTNTIKSSQELITVNKNVISEVLEALKNARENIQTSINGSEK